MLYALKPNMQRSSNQMSHCRKIINYTKYQRNKHYNINICRLNLSETSNQSYFLACHTVLQLQCTTDKIPNLKTKSLKYYAINSI